jgi:hypothetical protein
MTNSASGVPATRGRLTAGAALAVSAAVLLSGWATAPTAGVAPAPRDVAAGQDPCAVPVLPEPMRGQAAVAALGGRLTAVAARNGTTGRELAAHLREDRTLWVDQCGALMFVDEVPAEVTAGDAAVADGAVAPQWPATIAPADAFVLHSRPGSARVLYLDFDGHLVSGTSWNSLYGLGDWTAPAFSTDADPTTFTDAERAIVIDVWRRVAQDYAPFDIDVTTQDPGQEAITRTGSTDDQFGARVLITPDATQSQCGCGGRAYVDVFDITSRHAQYQPAWVYPQALSNSSKYIADAASHEAGHTLGLSHDGTTTSSYYGGSGGWGPIMGAPYSQAVTQWSDGSYPSGNNVQDDVAVIAGNGAPAVADDAGATPGDAVPLALPATVAGLVNSKSDVDVYSVSTGAGSLTVTAAPYWPGPNVDLAVTVTDATGAVVASAAPSYDATKVQASLSASVAVVVPEGTYSVAVEGIGNGIVGSAGEGDYGSAGWYTLTASSTNPYTPPPTQTPTSDPTTSSPPATSEPPMSSPPATSEPPMSSPPATSEPPMSSPPATSEPPTSPSPSPTPTSTAKRKPPGKPRAASIGSAALAVETSALPTVKRRVAYRGQLVASGGIGAVRWTKVKGALPKGLAMSASGEVAGVAVKRGTRKVRVLVTDSAGASAMRWVRIRVR